MAETTLNGREAESSGWYAECSQCVLAPDNGYGTPWLLRYEDIVEREVRARAGYHLFSTDHVMRVGRFVRFALPATVEIGPGWKALMKMQEAGE